MKCKILTIIISMCLITVLFVGCITSSGTEVTKGTEPVKQETQTQSTASVKEEKKYPIVDEPITITTIWPDSDAYTNDEGDRKILWEEIAKLTNINLKATRYKKEQRELLLAAGEWPDFFLEKFIDSIIYDYGVEGGRFVDYTDLLQYMPNVVKTMEDYPDSRKAVTEINGEMYQLPRINKAVTAVAGKFHYRKDVLNKLGLKMPTTTDEFYDVLATIYKSSGKAPLVDVGFKGQLMYQMFGPFGEALDPDFDADAAGTIIWNRMSDQYKYTLQYMNRLYKDGLFHQEFLTINAATVDALLKEGSAVFSGRGSGLVESDFESGKVELGVLAPLTSEYSNKQKIAGYDVVSISGGAINKDSKYAVEIAKVLDIGFATEEVAEGTGLHGLAFDYGPQGICWDYVDDTKLTYELFTPPGVPEDMT